MKPVIIIDNDSLVNLTQLSKFNIFNLLRSVFKQILIPEKVRIEYEKQRLKEPQREFILKKLRPNEGFWALCTRYDTLSSTLLYGYKDIHEGEAEIISQSEKTGIKLIISDDIRFKNACNKLNKPVWIYNTLFLLAVIDLHGFIQDDTSIFAKMYKTRPFKHDDLIFAYKEAARFFGLALKPFKISRKTYKKIII